MNKQLFFIVSLLLFSHATEVSGASLLRIFRPQIVVTLLESTFYHPWTVGSGLIYSRGAVQVVRIFKADSPFVAALKSNVETFTHFEEWICIKGKEKSSETAIQSMLDYFYSDSFYINRHKALQKIVLEGARLDSKRDFLFDLYCKVVNAALANNHAFFAALK